MDFQFIDHLVAQRAICRLTFNIKGQHRAFDGRSFDSTAAGQGIGTRRERKALTEEV